MNGPYPSDLPIVYCIKMVSEKFHSVRRITGMIFRQHQELRGIRMRDFSLASSEENSQIQL